MKNLVWFFFVFFGMMYVSPLLLIMIALVRTDISMGAAALYWLPISLIASLAMTYWYSRQAQKPELKQTS
jgi:hypothetical protein